MQDPTAFHSLKPHFAEQEHLKCPRCDSTNTKFCYYNNYNLSQPRHFCKNCRRYWTKGGALRNIPVGGGSRKNSKRSNSKRPAAAPSNVGAAASSTVAAALMPPKTEPPALIYNTAVSIDPDRQMLDIPGSFSSLLTSNGHFTNLLESMNPNSPAVQRVQFGEIQDNHNSNSASNSIGTNPNSTMELQSSGSNNQDNFLGLQGDYGWPDLAIYTPGSRFQ